MELLLATWSSGNVTELATRLILGCKGTAYQKLQLSQKELLTNDQKSIRKIVELVGGSSGTIPREKKFELVEKALFRGTQKQDETSDSYLSRVDVVRSELLAKGVDLKEIHSYIILRGSRITADDKKRVIAESGDEAESAGSVKGQGRYPYVGIWILPGNDWIQRLKTHDHTEYAAMEVCEEPDYEAYWVQEELDDQVLEPWPQKTMRTQLWFSNSRTPSVRQSRTTVTCVRSTHHIKKRASAYQKRYASEGFG
jgi:hypothetical protein